MTINSLNANCPPIIPINFNMKTQFKGINDIFKTQLPMFGSHFFYYCTDIFRQLMRMSEYKFMWHVIM